jgi:hypothetical protein
LSKRKPKGDGSQNSKHQPGQLLGVTMTDRGQQPNPPNNEAERAERKPNPIWDLISAKLTWAAAGLKPYDGVITALATVLLALVTIFLAFIAYWQFLELKRTDETLRLTMINGQRAYVGAKEPSVEGFESGLLKIGLTLTNTGQTPAKNLRATLAITVDPYPLQREMKQEAYVLDSVLLGKDIPLSKIESKRFTEADLAIIKEARSFRLYVRGFACYRDIFDQQRRLSFCFMYMGDPRRALALCEGNLNSEDQENCPQVGETPISARPLPMFVPVTPSGQFPLRTPTTSASDITPAIVTPPIITHPSSPHSLTLPNRAIEAPK